MRTVDEANQSSFVAPTGGTALKVAAIGWAILVLGGILLKDAHPLAPLFTVGLGVLCGVTAVVLGVLSLLGVGKDQLLNSSRPVAGVFGILLGGLMAALPLLLLPAINAARAAAEVAQFRNSFAEATGADPTAERVYCVDGKLRLDRPGYRWLLADEQAAKTFNANASAAAMNLPEGSKQPVTVVLITEEIVPEVEEMTLQEYAQVCGSFFTSNGFQQDGQPQESSLDDNRCLVTTYQSTEPDVHETVLLHCFSYGGYFVQCVCSGPPDLVQPAATELVGSIELFP